MFTGSITGLLQVFLVLALIGFALWKTGWIRIALSICIITWGVFAVEYDIKIAVPLLEVGTVLFIMGVLNRIKQHREQA